MDEAQELKNQIEELKTELQEMRETIANHGHTGQDGSTALNTTIEIDENKVFKTGSMVIEGVPAVTPNILVGGIAVGEDTVMSDGSRNTQVVINHDEDSFQSFMFGQRAPIYRGTDGDINAGGNTLQQDTYTWETNELAGAYVVANTSATEFDFYEIASNTSDTLTITGGTWSASEDPSEFFVFVPIYFGAAQYPWRRIYTMEGTGGGVRIGGGDTAGGQNGLLYMDSGGDLYWRNKAGSSTKLN